MDHATHSLITILTELCLLQIVFNKLENLSAVVEPFWYSTGIKKLPKLGVMQVGRFP
jgi:hypothetical protein